MSDSEPGVVADPSDSSAGTTELNLDAPVGTEVEEAPAERIDMEVEIKAGGACLRHVRVSIPRREISRFFDKEYSELVKSAQLPGFRPGKSPRRLVERRFFKDVSQQVKTSLLMKSLEQIGTENKLEPLSEPEIDVKTIELPEDGDFVYEFSVEVRPDFDVPNYKGLKIRRPTKQFTPEEVEEKLQSFLRSRGKMEPKDGSAEIGDYVLADVRFLDGDKVFHEGEDLTIRVEDRVLWKDGRIDNFAEKVVGARAGDSREAELVLADNVQPESLRGKKLQAILVIKEVSQLALPELTAEFFNSLGVADLGELRDLVQSVLVRQFAQTQLEEQREQIVAQLMSSVALELPQEFLRRQSDP